MRFSLILTLPALFLLIQCASLNEKLPQNPNGVDAKDFPSKNTQSTSLKTDDEKLTPGVSGLQDIAKEDTPSSDKTTEQKDDGQLVTNVTGSQEIIKEDIPSAEKIRNPNEVGKVIIEKDSAEPTLVKDDSDLRKKMESLLPINFEEKAINSEQLIFAASVRGDTMAFIARNITIYYNSMLTYTESQKNSQRADKKALKNAIKKIVTIIRKEKKKMPKLIVSMGDLGLLVENRFKKRQNSYEKMIANYLGPLQATVSTLKSTYDNFARDIPNKEVVSDPTLDSISKIIDDVNEWNKDLSQMKPFITGLLAEYKANKPKTWYQKAFRYVLDLVEGVFKKTD